MEAQIITVFIAAMYFGWLWNNRGAVEERELLASIEAQAKVKRHETRKRRAMKKLERRTKSSPLFNPNPAAEQELRRVA